MTCRCFDLTSFDLTYWLKIAGKKVSHPTWKSLSGPIVAKCVVSTGCSAYRP